MGIIDCPNCPKSCPRSGNYSYISLYENFSSFQGKNWDNWDNSSFCDIRTNEGYILIFTDI